MRLGKFLSNYTAISRLQRKPSNVLPMIAGTGEGIYYFLDQFVWCGVCSLAHSQHGHTARQTVTGERRLTKIRVLPKTWEKHIVFVSNIAELTGYAASITMNLSLLVKTISEIRILEHDIIRTSVVRPSIPQLRHKLSSDAAARPFCLRHHTPAVVCLITMQAKPQPTVGTAMQDSSLGSITGSQMPSGDDDMVVRSYKQLKASQARHRLLLVLIAKDLADALIAVQDVLGASTALQAHTSSASVRACCNGTSASVCHNVRGRA